MAEALKNHGIHLFGYPNSGGVKKLGQIGYRIFLPDIFLPLNHAWAV
jgi:hypothetical protein